ncbi:glycyl-radical activating family protein [Sporanaerobium hydrogeniformans]|uniref:Glycyl-radical activating family protein n=1 Tax=Sporanaerobium hydrogeniformans TaxID=3072179 RepID=A0AC61DC16_9FIRM|nr:glycyl-radical enzyme activating protein [Sporanaerobium hydrogeniformans]PHV70268.1 glycyl-radical activating family protein [Sporanaerobium hydrogeniformans]
MESLKVKGRIFDIQRYSVHDGPGIRTVVFLKGCFLRCKWCCNPESQNFNSEVMKVAGKDKVIGRDVTVEEVLEAVLRDRSYYFKSGGGVTLSGGEVLFQPDFTVALLKTFKENGLHTAIESSSFAKFETIERLLPYLDLYLMDIKHMDSAKHKAYTSQPNERILENAKHIAASGTSLIIRVPVIPGFNDTEEEIKAIASFTESLGTVEEIHLLPYHRLGQDKYEGLGRGYDLMGIEPLKEEDMEKLKQVVVRNTRLKCQIGG